MSATLNFLASNKIISIGILMAPLVGGIIKALMDDLISPVAEMIYPTTGNPSDKNIRGKELLNTVIKYAIMIALFFVVWIIFNQIVNMIRK